MALAMQAQQPLPFDRAVALHALRELEALAASGDVTVLPRFAELRERTVQV